MFHTIYPRKAFVSTLIRLHVQFNKRLVTMSIPKLSEESSERATNGGSSQINADRREADFNDVVTSSVGSDNEQAAAKFTGGGDGHPQSPQRGVRGKEADVCRPFQWVQGVHRVCPPPEREMLWQRVQTLSIWPSQREGPCNEETV
ncbi:hypothetical protein E3U43_006937 [Larimichthys crocea]|uniref:Uncharacterized protein n=1 Tax=Larimichthys crocea TaxID=215358 RepID=A0ACD3RLV9_LARCR|nr:hypothetical protein E3U43_006937 [Larimichthys crocea]